MQNWVAIDVNYSTEQLVVFQMISAEAPVLFAKAAEIFINELSLRAWVHTEDNKRRTLQRNDIAMAITKYDMFDFLIDIVPRDDLKPNKRQVSLRTLNKVRLVLTRVEKRLRMKPVQTRPTCSSNINQHCRMQYAGIKTSRQHYMFDTFKRCWFNFKPA